MNDKQIKQRKTREIYNISSETIRINADQLRGTQQYRDSVYIFAVRLNDLLDEKAITQEQFAHMTKISSSVVSKYRNGKGKPNADILMKMSTALTVSTDYLSGLSEVKSLQVDDKIIHMATGLSDEAISSLKEFKASSLQSPFPSPRLKAINFLLEQERDIPHVSPRNELQLQSYESAIDEWNLEHKLLSDIADYLSVRTDPAVRHNITYDGLRNDDDFSSKLRKNIETKSVAVDDEIVDTIMINRIAEKLKLLKKSYQKNSEKS